MCFKVFCFVSCVVARKVFCVISIINDKCTVIFSVSLFTSLYNTLKIPKSEGMLRARVLHVHIEMESG